MNALAFCVHVLTAFGAALALLALNAAIAAEWTVMFAILGVAAILDGIDGPLARRLRVAERVPRWSGDVLDLVVDFLTYVFIPAYVIVSSGLLPQSWGWLLGPVIVVTGALYFADTNMKTVDNHFRGFPATWNLVAFYLLLLRPAPTLAAAVIMGFAVLQFVPIKFVHPLRVRALRPVTLVMLAGWAVLAGIALFFDLHPEAWVTTGLCAVALYFLLIGLLPARRP